MLSIALIAAALLIAGFILQLRGRDVPQRMALRSGPAKASTMASASPRVPASSVQPIRPTVAMALRVRNPVCACENACRFADKTFLVGDAPQLPFKGCTLADCSCRYQPITDRRNARGDRRVGANRREEIRFEMKDDRRLGKDRRQANNVWKQPV